MIWKLIIVVILSYLIGSVNFSIILSRVVAKNDIRNSGSGNAGATNMYRTYGKIAGIATMVGDIVKVVVAIWIARLILGEAFYLQYVGLINCFAGFFCVMGHMFPAFFKFKGGKGVATCAGMILVLDWRIFLIEFAIFVIVIAITKMVSVGSIAMAVAYPFLTYFFYNVSAKYVMTSVDVANEQWVLTIIAVFFSLVIIFKHRENIKRIVNGNENKVGSKSRKKDKE